MTACKIYLTVHHDIFSDRYLDYFSANNVIFYKL